MRQITTCSRILPLVFTCLLAAGCGIYSAKSGRVDESIKRVSVPFLENRSSEPNIEIELTEGIVDALQEDNTLQVVDEGDADSVLTGQVLRYNVREAFTGSDLQVDEYQVQILVELDFTVIATGEKLFTKKRITGTGNYILNDPDNTELAAREDAATEIVRDVLALVVEDW